MKWRVELEYESGSDFTKLSGIHFKEAVYGGYDTKEEALEAFCYGQIAIDQLRKKAEKEQHKINPCEPQTNREDMDFDTGQAYTWEQKKREAEQKKEEEMIKEAKEVAKAYEFFPRLKICGEQKKEEGWDKAIKEAKEKYGYGKPDLGVNYGDNFLPPEGYTNGKERKIMERLEALEEAVHKPYIPFSVREAKDIVYKYQAKVEALGNRLTEIEGVLSSIGSPNYDLRKKVEEIEKDLYKVSHLLGKDDSTDELKISKLDVASQKIDLLLAFLEAVCRNLGNDIKKIK